MGINSNTGIASSVSASFSRSASILNSINISASVSRINVVGNAAAEQSLTTFQKGLKNTSTSVVSAGENIHSVAKEFQGIDQQLAQLTNFNLRGSFHE